MQQISQRRDSITDDGFNARMKHKSEPIPCWMVARWWCYWEVNKAHPLLLRHSKNSRKIKLTTGSWQLHIQCVNQEAVLRVCLCHPGIRKLEKLRVPSIWKTRDTRELVSWSLQSGKQSPRNIHTVAYFKKNSWIITVKRRMTPNKS